MNTFLFKATAFSPLLPMPQRYTHTHTLLKFPTPCPQVHHHYFWLGLHGSSGGGQQWRYIYHTLTQCEWTLAPETDGKRLIHKRQIQVFDLDHVWLGDCWPRFIAWRWDVWIGLDLCGVQHTPNCISLWDNYAISSKAELYVCVSMCVGGQKDMKHVVLSECGQFCQWFINCSSKYLALDTVDLAVVCCFCVVILFSIRVCYCPANNVVIGFSVSAKIELLTIFNSMLIETS